MTSQKANSRPDVNTIMSGFIDRSRWRWWDRVIVAHRAEEISFFQYPVATMCPFSGKLKTFRETNMLRAGQLPAPLSSVIFQVGFEILATPPSIDLFYNRCWMEFRIAEKVFLRGPLWRFREGNGYEPEILKYPLPNPETLSEEWRALYQTTLDELEATKIMFGDCRGYPGPQAGYRLNESARYLPPLLQFSVKLFFPDGVPASCDGLEVCAYLDGLTDFPVQ